MSKLYKGQYFITFYDKTDEVLLHLFDNVRDILKFMGKPVTRTNINAVNVLLYRALSTETHFTRFLTGQTMRVHLIDVNESDDSNDVGEDEQ